MGRPTARWLNDSQGFRAGLGIFRNALCFGGVFDLHVAELLGVKNLATLQTLDKLHVFVPGDDSNLGMSAGGSHRSRFSVEIMLLPPDCSRFSSNAKAHLFESSIGPNNFPFRFMVWLA
jgi:hypothetical protein